MGSPSLTSYHTKLSGSKSRDGDQPNQTITHQADLGMISDFNGLISDFWEGVSFG